MNFSLKQILEDQLQKIQVALTPLNYSFNIQTVFASLEKYYEQIVLFNDALSLVKAEGEELIRRHFLDCLAPLPYIVECVNKVYLDPPKMPLSVADLGSGNGLPGLVLACVRNDWNFFLIERMGRRAGFLRNAVAVSGNASHVKVIEQDIKNVKQTFDLILMRAFRPYNVVEQSIKQLCHEKTIVVVWRKVNSAIATTTINAPCGVEIL